jgi:hypothetical protein
MPNGFWVLLGEFMRGIVKLAVATAAVSVLTAAAAHATIVDISAVTATGQTPVVLHLTGGQQYQISWAGIAGGGLYDAFNTGCPNQVCPSFGWRNDVFFTVSASPGEVFHVTIPNPNVVNGTGQFASASAALQGYQTTPALWIWDIPPSNGIPTYDGTTQPWLAEPDVDLDVRFFIPDNTRSDNFGGVSLRVEAVAVPEPATWALMIVGFGAIGALVRRRAATLAA